MRSVGRLKSLTAFILVLLLLAAAAGTAFAAPAAEAKTIRMGYYSAPGMMNGAEGGAVKSGYAYEYIQELASHAGWKYEYVYGSFSELWQLLLAGRIDMLPYVTLTEERVGTVLYPEMQMGDEQFYIASLTSEKLNPSLERLNGKKLGAIAGAFYLGIVRSCLEEKNVDCELVEFPSPEEVWSAAAAGEVDYTIETGTVFQNIDLYAVYEFEDTCPFYIAAAPGKEELLTALNKTQRELYEADPGFLEDLKVKYFKGGPLFREIPDDAKAWLAGHKKIRVGTYANDEPNVILNADGTATGIAPDQVRLMMNALGVKQHVEWRVFNTRDELLAALNEGKIDCIYPYYHNYSDAEDEGLIISRTVLGAGFSILYKGNYTDETLSRIATPVSRLGGNYVRDNYPNAEVIPCTDGNECIEKLKNDEATCVVMHTDALARLSKLNGSRYRIMDIGTDCDICFAALPQSSGLISLINKAVPYVTDVERNEIQNRYSIESYSDSLLEYFRQHPERFQATIAILVVLILIMAAIRRSRDKKNARKLQKALNEANKANSIIARNAERDRNKVVESVAEKYMLAYRVNMADDTFTLLRMDDGVLGKGMKFKNFSEAKVFFINDVLHPADRDRMCRELDYENMKLKLALSKTYRTEYRALINGATLWHEMIITQIGKDEVAIGFDIKDEEITKRHLEDRRYEEYLAMFVVDIDTEKIQPQKTSPLFATADVGKAVPYKPAIQTFAAIQEGEAKEFFTRISDIEYMKREFAKDDKRTFSYKSAKLGPDKWIEVESYVIQRHDDGTPAMFTLGLSVEDALATSRQELADRLNEDMQIIGGLASEYATLYYADLDTGSFKVYSLDGQKKPEMQRLVSKGGDPLAILNRYIESGFIHRDDIAAFRELNVESVRERLAHSKRFKLRFRRTFGEDYRWCEMEIIKFADINEPAGAIAIGFADRDDEIRSEQALNRCFSVLGEDKTPEESINELLTIAGEFYGAERSYIFEFAKNREVISNTCEWCADGIEPMIDKLQEVPSAEIDGWVREFTTHGAFCMDTLETGGAYGSDEGRKLLEMQGIRSLIAAPIMNGEELVGFIGVDNPTHAEKSVGVLRNTAVVAFSEILQRRENDEEHVTLSKLTDAFLSVYYTDLSKDYIRTWKISEEYKEQYGRTEHYSVSMGGYVRNNIAVSDRERCIEMTSPEYVLKQFETKDRYSIDMTDIMLGYERNVVFDYIKVSDDGNQFVICCRDVTDSLEKEKQQQLLLQEARDAADAANKAKTSFLFNMSHDIRTPMNAITGFTGMAIKHIDEKEKVLDCLDKTQKAGGMLLSLINSVLEVSRIESGNATLEEQPGDVYLCFANIESTLQELAQVKDIDLSFSFGEIRNRYVYADFGRCMRVFVNIISNAVKYTGEGGYVKVRCEQLGEAENGVGTYRYTIADNGIGMSEEFQKHVFDQFSREKTATVSGIQGTGLGMAVCKSFVELMGGTISVQSKKGEGSTFTVVLPFKLQEGEAYIDPDSGDVVDPDYVKSAAEPVSFSGRKALLVEDNELNREIASEILKEEGIDVEEADDGTKAVELLREKGPEYYDFILMDIQMPIMGGYEATGLIRRMYPDVHIPIIALSANAFAEDKAASTAAGLDDHVAKPINVTELFTALSKFL